MNILDNEIRNAVQENMPYIIDAYAKVYGEEHRELIEKRANKILYVIYNNVYGIEMYMMFLRDCKKKELAIKFLEKIGFNIDKNQIGMYAEALDENIYNLIEHYIGKYFYIGDDILPKGIKAWKKDDDYVKQEKIKFINFLRGENKNQVTEETFQDFCKTDEYKEILEKIKEYLKIYDGIEQEYEDYLQELKPYEEYVQEENKRGDDLQKQKRNTIYKQIEEKLTDDIKNYLDEKYSNIDEKSNQFLGEDLGVKSYIEYFSKRDEEKLSYVSISQKEKDNIYCYRGSYFKSIGVKMRPHSINYKENYKAYIDGGYEKLIPTQELVQEITNLKEKAYHEYKKEFICNSKDFKENARNFSNTESIKSIYKRVKDNQICILGGKNSNGFIPILFFTIWNNGGGILDHLLLHEIGHAIETEGIEEKDDLRTGFEFGIEDVPKNPYNTDKRKYERLNETLRDMLSIEAAEILHKQGIYILEKKELIKNTRDVNTYSICKELLTNFLNKYRKEVIGVLLYGDIETLYNTVGEENFEELNDIVNRVDYMIEKFGLMQRLANNPQNEDTVLVEYYKQLERLNKVYDNMERHKLKKENTNNLLQSAISATEEITRLGSINDAINNISNEFRNEKDENEQKYEGRTK